MPKGVPVATVAINGAMNAAILAAQIIGLTEKAVKEKQKLMKIMGIRKKAKHKTFFEELEEIDKKAA